MKTIKLYEYEQLNRKTLEDLKRENLANHIIKYYNENVRTEDNIIIKLLFLEENDIIVAMGYVDGFADSLDCKLDIILLNNNNDYANIFSTITNYLFNNLKMQTINIQINSSDKELIRLAINNNYELIDKSNDICNYVIGNPKIC